nr:hypothetical protein [uncultured Flavobacterium sp.]
MCNCRNCRCSSTTVQVGPVGDTGATGAAGATGATGGQIEMTIPITSGTATLLETQTGGKVILDRAAGAIIGLPNTPADGTNYTFITKTDLSSNNYVINAGDAGLDSMFGYVYAKKAGTADEIFQTASATHITMNGTTTGGDVGTNLKLSYDATNNRWYVSGSIQGSGALGTPFS